MIRRVIEIDQDACNGCGLCVSACHEGAIQLVGGKAKLVRDDYCDGLGDCLPSCPTGAISFVEREAAPYDEAAVIAAQMRKAQAEAHKTMPAGGCPGSAARAISRDAGAGAAETAHACACENSDAAPKRGGISTFTPVPSELRQWPIQIKLVPTNAPYLKGAKLLVAADCTAFAYGAFHNDFMKGRICIIGCPKLDGVDYTEKLTQILAENDIDDVLVTRMQVPCCGGIEHAVRTAADQCGHPVKVNVVTISAEGEIVSEG